MTPTDYRARLNDAADYIAVLLCNPADRIGRQVAQEIAIMADSDRRLYIRALVENPGRREREIGEHLEWILFGAREDAVA
jgi:hypothetical protein